MSTDIHPDAHVPAGGNPVPPGENGNGALVPSTNGHVALTQLPWPYGAPVRPEILSAKPNPIELLHSFRRRWPLAIGLGLAIAGSVAALIWFLLPVKYEAVAWLRIAAKQNTSMLAENDYVNLESFKNYKQTQTQLIKSPTVLTRVLGKPEIQRLPIVKKQKDDLGWLQDELMVDAPDGEIMQIAMSGDDPKAMIMIVNAVKDVYMSQIVNKERDQRLEAKRKLERELDQSRQEAAEKSDRLSKLEKDLNLSGTESSELQQKKLFSQIEDLQKRRSDLNKDLTQLAMKIMLIKKQQEAPKEEAAGVPDAIIDAEINRNPLVGQLQQQQIGLRMAVARELKTAKNPKARSVRKMQEQLEMVNEEMDTLRGELKAQLIEQYKASMGGGGNGALANLPLMEATAQASYAQFKGMSDEIDKAYADLAALVHSSSDAESIRSELIELKKVNETIGTELKLRALDDLTVPRVTAVDEAQIPKGSNALQKYLIVAFSSLLAFGLTVFGVAYAEFQSRKLNRGRDVNEGLGIRVMGDLPRLSGRAAKRPELMQAILTESIDSIRTALIHTTAVQSPRVVMVTSAETMEGKTTVASQLAASLARSGRRTLLVDADVRNPSIHEVFDLPNEPGFCEVLRGTSDRSAVIQPTHAPNLWLVAAGLVDMTSIQLLASPQLGAMLKAWREEFEYVILDIGPVLQVADPLLVGQHVDAAILSSQCDISKMGNVYDACERLKSVGVTVLGAVVNGSCTRKPRRGKYLPRLTQESADNA